MKSLFTAIFLFLGAQIYAQDGLKEGLLIGTVQTEDGRALIDVEISADNHTVTCKSDIEGKFKLNLQPGKHVIEVSHPGFETSEDTIEVSPNKESFINFALRKVKDIKNGVQITVKAKGANTAVGAVMAKKGMQQFADIIPAEDLVKSNVRTTGDALKKVPGATIMEGKFANIRGMYDRYNAGYLNGAPLPSTETDRKAFSFDIIPSNLLDNIMVIKSGTPDLTGDFGGGIIRITTKSIPEKMVQNFSLGFQYNSITTFRSVNAFSMYGSEWMGATASQRNLPALNADLRRINPEINAAETKKFNNDWKIKSINPMPAPRFSYSLGMPIKFKNHKEKELGLLVSLNYSLNNKFSESEIRNYDYSDNRIQKDFRDQLYTVGVQSGGIINLSYKANNKNRLDFKNLYTLNYDQTTTIRSGISDYDNGVSANGYSELVNNNRLLSTQLNGMHSFGKSGKTQLNWLVNRGMTKRSVPDYRIAQYAIIEQDRFLVLNDFFSSGTGRFFSNLTENTTSGSVDLEHTIETKTWSHKLKTGLFTQLRDRSFTSREFVYGPVGKTIYSKNTPENDLSNDQISASNIFLVEKTSRDIDEYNGTTSLYAGYLMSESSLNFGTSEKARLLRIIYGARVEQFSAELTNEALDKVGKKVASPEITTDLLPSINIITPLGKKSNLRAAYYKTLNRPEMREWAQFTFYNFNLNSEFSGNPNLRRAVLHNYDVRYEIYPSGENMFSIGGFYKKIINPIEFSLDLTQALVRTFTYGNEKSATIYGTEIEFRRNLKQYKHLSKIFEGMSLYGNLTLIKSQIDFTENSNATRNRQLQGQSPFVVNASLFYEHPKTGYICNISFNRIGSRIAYIGASSEAQPNGFDIYEKGRSVLDIQVGKNFKTGSLKLTFGDLLAQNLVFYQDVNKNNRYDGAEVVNGRTDNTLFNYTFGRTLTVSYTYSF